MEPISSSETSAYNNTLTPGTYPKEKKIKNRGRLALNNGLLSEGPKLESKFGDSLLGLFTLRAANILHFRT